MKSNRKREIAGIAIGILGVAFVCLKTIANKKVDSSRFEGLEDEKNVLEGKRVVFVADERDEENADGVRGHLEAVGDSDKQIGIYANYVKRGFDIILSFGGLVVLSPIYALIAIAIKIDDPGPVLFTQKRVGKNKEYFKLHKFRSMKMSTPRDVPTHMLDNPEQYITKMGKFLRAHSLDELPQIWDIFIGNMSIIGPRPALWNQDVLTAERDRYGVNDIKPGLTGLAQINGRDEIDLQEKARLDGKYVENMSFINDVKLFIGSISVFSGDNSIVEGSASKKKKENAVPNFTMDKSNEEIIGNIGFSDSVEVDLEATKKILITGANSYIGESFIAYATKLYSQLTIETLDMLDDGWAKKDFSEYDIVYHLAGIAHADTGNINEAIKQKYYNVNTDLAVEVCKKAKIEGVKTFIFMSSMIIYGDSAPYGKSKVICSNSIPKASSFYGDSKLRADVAVRSLATNKFKVIVIRPPMIYGRGSKGNYSIMSKIAKKIPVFPNAQNERSMLYISNLCEFLCQIMLIKEVVPNSVVLFPQNREWSCTTEMVREIAIASGKKIKLINNIDWLVNMGGKIPGKIGKIVNKAFGNMTYESEMSEYEGIQYQIKTLSESIKETESNGEKKKVLFLVNHDVVIYNFRLELVERLISDGFEVHISSPYGERIEELKDLGAVFHEIEMERHGMNPLKESKLLVKYSRQISEIRPDVILGYTIKPNLYGALVANKYDIPFIANITGLGTAVETQGLSQTMMIYLYKLAFKNVKKVFFQNSENQQFFIKNRIALGRHGMLPGSGVNLKRFTVSEYPSDDVVKFAFISRIMKEKGIDQYLEAAKIIKRQYPNTEFHICGFCEAEYEGKLSDYHDKGYVIYHGMIRNVSDFMSSMNCIVHPTYYPEGLSNVLLEASACGRPIITTDRAGCREVVDDGINGFMIPQKDSDSLVVAIKKFINLNYDDKKAMGLAARSKVELEFDREIVVEAYMKEINKDE